MKLNCKEASVLLSQAQDRPLGLIERAKLETHLALCAGCENFRKQLDFLRRAIRRHPALQEDEQDEGPG